MYQISKKFKFECAHKLNNLREGHPCSCIHGHSYKVEVVLKADKLNDHGFVIDFGDLKLFQKFLDENFDHALVVTSYDYNERDDRLSNQKYFVMPIEYNNTSAENFAHFFCNKIIQIFEHDLDFSQNVVSVKVKVWETENNYASYEKTVV